jgi:transposase-like protein
LRNADEPEIWNRKIVVRAGREGYSPGDAQAIFGRGENPHRSGWPSREHSIAELCRREGIAESLYYTWSKEFLEAGKRRLAGDTARAATSGEVKDLRRDARALED